jgi:chemotaxis signal transduction protein
MSENREKEQERCKYCGNCDLEKLEKLQANIKDSIIILKRIDKKTEENTEVIGLVVDKINVIETVASKTALEISKNTSTIAENMKETTKTNKELIEIIAGKKQVPLSIFVIVLSVASILQFIAMVTLFGIHLKFGSVIVGGEIIPKLTLLTGI